MVEENARVWTQMDFLASRGFAVGFRKGAFRIKFERNAPLCRTLFIFFYAFAGRTGKRLAKKENPAHVSFSGRTTDFLRSGKNLSFLRSATPYPFRKFMKRRTNRPPIKDVCAKKHKTHPRAGNSPQKKKRTVSVRKSPFFSSKLFILIFSFAHHQRSVGDKRGNNQPNRGCRYDGVYDDRTDAPRAGKHQGNEVDVEKPEKPPIDSPKQNKYIRNNIRYTHIFSSCFQYAFIKNNLYGQRKETNKYSRGDPAGANKSQPIIYFL